MHTPNITYSFRTHTRLVLSPSLGFHSSYMQTRPLYRLGRRSIGLFGMSILDYFVVNHQVRHRMYGQIAMTPFRGIDILVDEVILAKGLNSWLEGILCWSYQVRIQRDLFTVLLGLSYHTLGYRSQLCVLALLGIRYLFHARPHSCL